MKKIVARKFVASMACCAVALALGVFGVLSLSGCGESAPEGVAATVDGEEIPEDVITTYVENFIDQKGLSTEGWAQYLGVMDTTAEGFREDTIDYYIRYLLYEHKATELGIEVTQDEVDQMIDNMKESKGYSDEEYLEYLDSYGYTEDSYEASLRYNLLVSKVQEQDMEVPEATEEDELNFADEHLASYEGKHVYAIMFKKKVKNFKLAERTLDKILKAKNPAKEFMKNVKLSQDKALKKAGGEVGWSCINSLGSDWDELVQDFKVGKVYKYLYQDDDGMYIYYCDDEFVPSDYSSNEEALEAMPKGLRTLFDEDVQSELSDNAVQDYADKMREAADVVVYPMPSGLSYDVEAVKTDE